jgi:hypothetical protein
MIVAELYLICIAVAPAETDAPLIIARMLCWPARFPRNASSRLAGGTRRNVKLAALSIKSSFRLALTAKSLGKPFTYRPRDSAAVRLSANDLITA